MNSERNNILVQKYLGNELSKAERKDFEQELKSNIDLQTELDLQQNIESSIKDNTLDKFRTKLHTIHQEILGDQKKIKLFSSKAVSLLAASIVLVLTVGSLLLYIASDSTSTLDVYNDYYEPYEMSITTRTAVTKVDSNLDRATNYYTNLEYKNAKFILEDLKLVEGNNSRVLMMLGISNLELDLLDEAKDNFSMIIKIGDILYCQQAKWYLALSFMKSEDKASAILHFESIISENRYYKERAQEVLSLLE